MDFEKKKKIRTILHAKITIIVLGLILAFFLNSAYGVYKKAKAAQENKEVASVQFSALQEREAALVDDIERLKTDRGVEEVIRERFGVAREGEEVIVIVDSGPEKVENGSHAVSGPRAWWRKIVEFF